MKKIVAIDGPAGSGKGTIAKMIAEKCNLQYIDSGATYRCVALSAIENSIDTKNEKELINLTKSIKIDFINGKTYLNDKDVSNEIRNKEVSDIVSIISSNVKLREILVELQRNMAKSNDVIMEGRDITTVVFPDANYKFYLDADLLIRAERRYKQNIESGINTTYEEVLENIKTRDYNDMNKKQGALKRTDEQIYIDSTDLTIEEVANKIIEIIRSEIK